MNRPELSGSRRSVEAPMLVDDGLESWERLTLYSMVNYWRDMYVERVPIAWSTPPVFDPGYGPCRALMVETVAGRAYRVSSYQDFHRLMLRDGYLKLVFESGREEIVLAAFQLRRGPSAIITLAEPCKVLPFRKPLL